MIPKEKAIELLDKYVYYARMYNDDTPRLDMQKECVLIAVDELIYETQFEVPNIRQRYWIEVKQEIEKL
jgi:hypothetical protein